MYKFPLSKAKLFIDPFTSLIGWFELWKSKKISLIVVLMVGVVVMGGCLEERLVTTTTTSMTTTIKSTSVKKIIRTLCHGCTFIDSRILTDKPKNYINFDILGEKAKRLNYTVNLSDYSPSTEENQTIHTRNIEIKKDIENYTAQIIISEKLYLNGTKVQSVDRVYFGGTCDFEFARSKMVKVLDELGIWIQGHPPAYTGLPDRPSHVAGCPTQVLSYEITDKNEN